MDELLFDTNEGEVLDSGNDTTGNDSIGGGSTGGGPIGSVEPMIDEGDEEDEKETQTSETVVDTGEENINNPAYVKKVKEGQFGEIYNRLVSDEKESQCAEFLAPQLIKQDRLYKHTFNAAYGQFY